MLKFTILAALVTLCLSDFSEDGDVTCDDCQVPDGEFPMEGEMACFQVKRGYKTIAAKTWVQTCHEEKCKPFDFFCMPHKKCIWEMRKVNISIPHCKLERKTGYKPIERIGSYEAMYLIHSPHYYHGGYPNNTYCVWNVANGGLVSSHIMDQQLEEPRTHDCRGPACTCPDNAKITMGFTEVKLCGSEMPSVTYMLSSNGLHVKFCSDNKNTAKGIFLSAFRFSNHGSSKRNAEQWQKPDEDYGNYTKEVDNATCQYDFMMRALQPDVPCPNNLTILNLWENHNHLMSAPVQDEMCSEMGYPTEMKSAMPKMNKIEMCAVEYLLRTRNCDFARKVVKSTNKELRNVARAVLQNDFPKTPKGMNIKRCSYGEE